MNTLSKRIAAGILALATMSFASASGATSKPAAAAAQSSTALTEGEVRKIDKEAGKITIRHGELKNLGMPPMTMVFRVKDRAMLEQVKPGDRIRFIAEKISGRFTVMQIETDQTDR